MLLMRLKNFNYFISLLFFLYFSPLVSEEKIDIWKNQKKITPEKTSPNVEKKDEKLNTNSSQTVKELEKIQIQEGSTIQKKKKKVYGIYDPANYDLSLNMWTSTRAEDLRSSLKRLKKINLSKSSNEILEMILFSFAYPPQDMSEEEFIELKTNWLIQNDRIDLIEDFS